MLANNKKHIQSEIINIEADSFRLKEAKERALTKKSKAVKPKIKSEEKCNETGDPF